MLHHLLAVVMGIAQQHLRTLGALEPEMGVVVPGEADAAMDLDGVDGRLQGGLAGGRLGERRHRDDVLVTLVERRGGVVGR